MSGKNLIRKVFSIDSTWTAPAGVKSIRAFAMNNFGAQVSVGNGFTSAVLAEFTGNSIGSFSSAQTMGLGTSGQLGNGNITARSSPVILQGVSADIIQLSSGDSFSAAIISAVASSGLSSTAKTWGANTNGELGDGTILPKSTAVSVLGTSLIRQLSCGNNHTVAADIQGAAYTWGLNGDGQLGISSVAPQSTPVAVVGNHFFKNVAAGRFSSFGIDMAGAAWAWGYNATGQLGDNTVLSKSSPIAVLGGHVFTQIAAGGTSSAIALDSTGAAWTWGDNSSGQLGDGTITSRSTPVAVLGGKTFKYITMGGSFCIAIDQAGFAWSWGAGASGRLGDGTTTNKSSPVAVSGGNLFRQVASSGVSASAAGIDVLGLLRTWGDNTNGQLGDGTTTSKSSPITVTGPNYYNATTDIQTNSMVIPVSPGSTYSLRLFWHAIAFEQYALAFTNVPASIILEYEA